MSMIAFTFPSGRQFNKSIFLLKRWTGEVQRFEDERLDFTDTRTVLVKNKLYVFAYGSPVSVYSIADFTSTAHLVKTTLSTLPRNEQLNWFSVSLMLGSIILTGGIGDEDVRSAKTYLMDVQTGRW